MTDTEAFIVTLSREELVCTLRLADLPSPQGIDDVELQRLPEEQRELLLAAAARALRARGLLAGARELSPQLRLALTTAACARRTMSVMLQLADGTGAASAIARHQSRWVERDEPADGLVRLSVGPSAPMIVERLSASLGLADQPALPVPPFDVAEEEIEQLQALSNRDQAALDAALQTAGVPPDAAGAFADLLSGPRAGLLLQLAERRVDTVATTTITVLANPTGRWLLRTLDGRLHCRPIAAQELRAELAALAADLAADEEG